MLMVYFIIKTVMKKAIIFVERGQQDFAEQFLNKYQLFVA